MTRGLVAKILPFSAVDGPGNRAVVFLQGCDFDCRYCHNPETRAACVQCGLCVPACPVGALSSARAEVSAEAPRGLAVAWDPDSAGRPGGLRVSWDPARCVGCGACVAACPHGSSPKARLMSPAEVLSGLGRYRPFLSGITVSGGECGLQAQFLQALVEAARDEGLPALVDTNGSTDYSLLPGLVEAAAGFMLDVKAWDEADHLALTGAPNRNVLANLRFLLAAGKLYEARTVVAPGLFDAASTVREVARAIAAAESRAPSAGSARRAAVRYKLIRFRPQGVRDAWRSLSTPDDAEMEALADSARSEGAREVVVV